MLLIKNAKIVDPGGKYDNQVQDVFIKNGKIAAIEKNLNIEAKVVDLPDLHLSIGWLDVGVFHGEPGLEQRETVESLSEAAISGGFTGLIIRPDLNPSITKKNHVDFVMRNGLKPLLDTFVFGALRSSDNSSHLSEMYELNDAGVKGFVDQFGKEFDPAFLMRSLQYIKGFEGVLIFDASSYLLNKGGQINEGIISTSLGMPGMPNIAEKLAIYQMIQLVEYTASRMHIQNVSTKEGVQLIKDAKKRGLDITASVAASHLVLDENSLEGYNVNCKVKPALRTKKDKTALLKAVVDGTIDFVNSNHQSIEIESKKVEFPYAEFGIASIENTYSLLNMALGNKMNQSEFVKVLAKNNRRIFNIELPLLEEGQKANLTLFTPKESWNFNIKDIKSKGKNNPFIGTDMVGRVYGVINNNKNSL